MKQPISFRLNGAPTKLEVDSHRLLLWVLRTDLDLTGTKYGCGTGDCGSCTVMVDGVSAAKGSGGISQGAYSVAHEKTLFAHHGCIPSTR